MRNTEPKLLARQPGARWALALAALVVFAGAPPLASQDIVTVEPPGSARVRSEDGDLTLVGDRTVEAGEVVQDIVVAGGDLRVRGEVEGDALVIGGKLILEESGVIRGDAVVAGGEIVENGGRVFGEMLRVDDLSALAGLDRRARDRVHRGLGRDIEEQIEEAEMAATEAHNEARRAARVHHERSWFDPIKRGLAGVFSTLALGLVLAGIGAVLIFYGRPYLETVSDTLRGSLWRSGAVGLAAAFLVIPGFVVLIVALAVSIVGIPLLLLAVPLYPVAVAAAVAMGLLAAAHALGERTAEQRTPFNSSYRNAYSYLFTGLAMFLAPMLVAHLLVMAGLGWLGGLLIGLTVALIWAAATIGLGAVVLSRGGTRRTFTGRPPADPTDPDPLFDRDPYPSDPTI